MDAAENEDVSSKPAASVANLLLGPEGSHIDITVMRSSDGPAHDQEFLTFCLTRKRTDAVTARYTIASSILLVMLQLAGMRFARLSMKETLPTDHNLVSRLGMNGFIMRQDLFKWRKPVRY